MDGDRQTVTAADAPAAIGPYSHAVRVAGELLFCSGQIPLDPATGELVGESAGEQARRCLDNLRAVCTAAGTTLERAVKLTIYMTDLERFGEVNEVCAEAFPEDPPARATVGVAALPRDAQVEIDAVVVLPLGAAAPAGPGQGASASTAGATLPPALGSPPTGAAVPPALGGHDASTPTAGAPAPPALNVPLPVAAPGQAYHVELRHFPRNLCRFNLSGEELYTTVLAPWVADRPFELGELKWDPRQARLTVLEGPRVAPGDLTMGRGWGVAKRRSQDVTERVLAAATPAPPSGPGQ